MSGRQRTAGRTWLTVAVAATTALVVTGCSPTAATDPSPSVTQSATHSPTPSPTPTISGTPSPSDDTSTSPLPDPIMPPQSRWTDARLAALVSKAQVKGQTTTMADAARLRWNIASTRVNPTECSVLLTGVGAAGARGLPLAMGVIGQVGDQYTITIAGTDPDTLTNTVTEWDNELKRCSRLSTVEGDPAGANLVTTQWVVRQVSADDFAGLDNARVLQLNNPDAGWQQVVVTGSVGDVLVQVQAVTDQTNGGQDLTALTKQLIGDLQVATGVPSASASQSDATHSTAPASGRASTTPSPSASR